MGAFGDFTGERDTDEERTHRGGNLQLLGDTRDEQGQSEDDEEQHLGVVGGDSPADEPAVAQGHIENGADGAQRDQQGETSPARLSPASIAVSSGR